MSAFHSLSFSTLRDQQIIPPPLTVEPLPLTEPAAALLQPFTGHALLRIDATTEIPLVRALLEHSNRRWSCVIRHGQPVGLIALRDLSSWQAAQKAQQLQLQRWSELSVAALMLPLHELPALTTAQLEQARVGDLIETFRKSGEDFMVVHEQGRLVGAIARCEVEEQTGFRIDGERLPTSFADIVHHLHHPGERH